MLTELTPNVWTEPAPLTFLGVHVGTSMTVVRLRSGDLFVHSPISLASVRATVEQLGLVRHIVAPNAGHHLYAGEWKDAYPEATLYAAGGVRKKRKDLTVDKKLDDTPPTAWDNEFETVRVKGFLLNETVFFHRDTQTMVSADMLENYVEPPSHWPTRLYARMGGVLGKPGVHKLIRPMFRDRKKARRAIDQIQAWDPTRVTLAHGDHLHGDCGSIVKEAYAWLK